MIHRVTTFIASALIAFAFAAAFAQSSELRIGMSSEPTSMDPHFHNLASNNNIAAHIFEPLTRFDSDSKLVPALAESWQLLDDTTWEFKLRKDVKFHDGSNLTAEDVVWSLDRPAVITGSPGAFTLYTRQIASKQIIDSLTIRLKTITPYPLMLNDLSSIFVVSRKATQGLSSEDFSSGKGMIGTGPFRFVSFSRGER